MNYNHIIHINIIKSVNAFKMLLNENDKKNYPIHLKKY